MSDVNVDIADAIIAGIASEDTAVEKMSAILVNLERAGYAIVPAQDASEYEAHLRAINDLVTLSEEDYCSDDTEEGEWREPDDEPVAAGENSVSAITFGDVRRAREAIDALMAAVRTPAEGESQTDAQLIIDQNRTIQELRSKLSMAEGTLALQGIGIDTHATDVATMKRLAAQAVKAEKERDQALSQVESARSILDAARLWRESLEGDGWDKDAIESGICRPGISELMRAVDSLPHTSTVRDGK